MGLEGGRGAYLYLLSVGESQGQFVAVDAQFHRVAEGCELLQRHLCAGNHAHVEEMLTECAFAANLEDDGRLSFIEFS